MRWIQTKLPAAILALSVLLGACQSVEWDKGSIVGDVAVEDRGEEHTPRYWLRFPEISLSRDATHTFVLRSCPAAMAHFALLVLDPVDATRIRAANPELDLTIAGTRGTVLRFDGVFAERPGDPDRQRWAFGDIGGSNPLYYPAGVGTLRIDPEQQYLFLLRVEVSSGAALAEDLRVRPALIVVNAPQG